MATDPKKRQKQQQRHAAKRKAKHQQLSREKQRGAPESLAAAAECPILHCWAMKAFWTEGMGQVCLSRVLPNGTVAFSIFLLDRYCLGVKNAMAGVKDRPTYDSQIERKIRSHFPSKNITPATARKMVEGAVEYARALGFQPHADYHKAKLLFGAIDPKECTEEFDFGKDGKPFFIGGPHDTPSRCSQIMKTLERTCGLGGFDFLIPIGPGAKISPVPLEQTESGEVALEETGRTNDSQMDYSDGDDSPDS